MRDHAFVRDWSRLGDGRADKWHCPRGEDERELQLEDSSTDRKETATKHV